MSLLEKIIEATDSTVGYLMVNQTEAETFLKAEFIEANPELTTADGLVAVRVTDAGREAHAKAIALNAKPAIKTAKPVSKTDKVDPKAKPLKAVKTKPVKATADLEDKLDAAMAVGNKSDVPVPEPVNNTLLHKVTEVLNGRLSEPLLNVSGYAIIKGDPMPARASAGRITGQSKYPFALLEVGDSFKADKNLASSTTIANRHLKPMRFKCLVTKSADATTSQVWRVADRM